MSCAMARAESLYYVMLIMLFTKSAESSTCMKGCNCEEDSIVRCHIPEITTFTVRDLPENTTVLDLTGNNVMHLRRGTLEDYAELSELRLANNKIYSIQAGTLKNKNMEKLNLEDNNIHFLANETFIHLPNLRFVNISNNRLKEFPNFEENIELEALSISNNKISAVKDGALKHNTNLREIYLSSLGIKYLTKTVFPDDKSNLTVVDLTDNQLWTVPSVIKEMKNLEKLYLSSNPIKTFASQDFRPLGKLRTLEMANVGMKEVPENLFWLPLLKHLDISRNQISGSSLRNIQFSNLATLKMDGNRIGIVADDAFAGIPNLEVLAASSCDISVAQARAFTTLLKLRILDLSSNNLNTLPTLQENRYLEELLLDNNEIQALNFNVFKRMENLRLLSLANNSLTTIGRSYLPGELTITTLNLSGNKFQSLPGAIVDELTRLKSLDMSANSIYGEFPLTSISDLENLQSFDLRRNNISKISPDTDTIFWSIEKLYLCENNITELDSSVLDKFPQLEELYADGNSIETISDSSFYYNPFLRKLFLNSNSIKEISGDAFSQLTELDELMLMDNSVKDVPKLSNNIGLKALGLCNNPIGSMGSAALSGPKGLETLLLRGTEISTLQADAFGDVSSIENLDLANNNLSSIPNVVRSMTSLRSLELSGNPIAKMPPDGLTGLTGLRVMHLDKMKLSSLDVTELVFIMPGLRSMWLAGNPWRCDCEMEALALGIDIGRSHVEVADRSKMVCVSPSGVHGRFMDTLDMGDFMQCTPSRIISIHENSALMRIPVFGENVLSTVSYASIPGIEKTVNVAAGIRQVKLRNLIPDTNYIACVYAKHQERSSFMISEQEPTTRNHNSHSESCIKFRTTHQRLDKPWLKGGFGGPEFRSRNLLIIYLVLSGVILLSLMVVSLTFSSWYKRRKTTLKDNITRNDAVDFHDVLENIDSSLDKGTEPVEDNKIKKPKRTQKDKQNGTVMEMTNEGGCDNEACDGSTTPQRTKL